MSYIRSIFTSTVVGLGLSSVVHVPNRYFFLLTHSGLYWASAACMSPMFSSHIIARTPFYICGSQCMMLPERYEKYAIFRYENGLQSDLPTAEEFSTHLKFLKCLQGLYDIITSSVDNENAQKKLWDCYTRIAERRFLIFAARLKEETMKLTDEEFIKYMRDVLPPLDILLVWHAVVSHPKLSFDNFHRYDFFRFVNYPFPLTLIEDAISNTTFLFEPHKKYVAAFNALVNLYYDAYPPFNPCMKLPLFCPLCSNFIADISLLDETFTKCQLDEMFTFPSTCNCFGNEVTPDILRKRRFIKDCNNKRFLPNIVKEFLSAKRLSSLIKEIQKHDLKVKAYKDLDEFRNLSFHEFVDFIKNVKKDDMGYRMLLPYSNMTLLPFTVGSKILDYTRSIQKGVLVLTKLLNKIAHVNWYGLLCDAEVAIERYEKFVALFKRAEQPLMPTLDIELVWITHQLSQGHFFQFWKDQVGIATSFQNASTFGASFNYTNNLYVQYYNEEYTDMLDQISIYIMISLLERKVCNYDIILGSSSARRSEILEQVLKLPNLRILVPDFEENLSKDIDANLYAARTSKGKLDSILKLNSFSMPTIVICCDTIIQHKGKILEKPGSIPKQREMFEAYAKDPKLEVISAISLAKIDAQGRIEKQFDTETSTLVFDSSIEQEIIDDYILSEEGLHVAGGFKYQESGNFLFTSLQGDYFNVVGLPARRVFQMLWSWID